MVETYDKWFYKESGQSSFIVKVKEKKQKNEFYNGQ